MQGAFLGKDLFLIKNKIYNLNLMLGRGGHISCLSPFIIYPSLLLHWFPSLIAAGQKNRL